MCAEVNGFDRHVFPPVSAICMWQRGSEAAENSRGFLRPDVDGPEKKALILPFLP